MPLTETQKSEFKEAFLLWDTNRDGKVNVSELGVMMRSLGANPTEAELRIIIQQIANEGSFDLPSFLQVMTQAQTKIAVEKEILEAFKVFDTTNTGFIPTAELRHVLMILGEKLTDEEMKEMIKEADDGSGRINYRKYTQVLLAK